MPANEVTLVVIGESLVDIISDPRQPEAVQVHPGGSPLNVAVGAARLGLRTSLVTHYADDRNGLLIDEHLQANGVQVINGGTAPTSTALAALGPDGGADYTFSISWDISGASLPALAAVEGSAHVHTGSIASMLAPGDAGDSCRSCRPPGSMRPSATTPTAGRQSAPMWPAARRQAELFVAASDIVKASDEDLSWLYPDRTPEETLQAWLESGPRARGPDPRSRWTGHRLGRRARGDGGRTH